MSKFKVGDRVRVLADNESDLNGEVIKLFNNKGYNNEVKWDNGSINIYRESDLELVESKSKFKVGHGAICIKKTHEHNVGDVLLVSGVLSGGLRFEDKSPYFLEANFTPCPNPPRTHYKQRIAYALGADIETQHFNWPWCKVTSPVFYGYHKYRVAIPDPNAEKREKLQAEIARLQSELDNLGGEK